MVSAIANINAVDLTEVLTVANAVTPTARFAVGIHASRPHKQPTNAAIAFIAVIMGLVAVERV